MREIVNLDEADERRRIRSSRWLDEEANRVAGIILADAAGGTAHATVYFQAPPEGVHVRAPDLRAHIKALLDRHIISDSQHIALYARGVRVRSTSGVNWSKEPRR